MLRDVFEVRVELGARVHRAGRVVRVADVDELRARRHGSEQCAEVVPVIVQRYPHGFRAELQRVDDVAREGRPAADDLVARIENRLRDAVDHPVRA